VIVIGATNIPDNLDPALRRPGRFDREIEIGVPDRDGRLEILEIHTRSMPFSEDVNLKRIAQETHGFSGADLSALAREAAMKALRRIFPDVDFQQGTIPQEKLDDLRVTAKDFDAAKKEVHPSALREVFLEKSDVGWEDVGGLEDVKEALKEAVEWPLIHPELFEHTATIPPRGILITGPPGCGKTLIAKAVAKETEVNFISVKGPELVSKWVGDTEKHIREIFRKAKQAAPCIIFFDEIDAIAPRRGRDSSQGSDRALSQLLNEIDGIEELKGVVLLAATNRVDLLDEAILRPGRFDIHFELLPPDTETRLKIFEIHTRRKPIAKGVDLRDLANQSEGFTGADFMGICVRASLLAMREFLESGEKDLKKCVIASKHFKEAFRQVLPDSEKAGAES
jgi:transitional endoplasmic reticulum ATPase